MTNSTFLFSLDLEDIRNRMVDGDQYGERVPVMVARYLNFLEECSSTVTFFVVGDVARAYPSLIKEIADAGHEIACHSDTHIELHRQSPGEFEVDLGRCMDSLDACNIGEVKGYRAPVFSLTDKSEWVYPILQKMGIVYSSSVLPADNPLNGWKEFGTEVKRVGDVWEIPITISTGLIKVPFAGGVYFRTLPYGLVKRSFRKHNPVVGYFHTYDIDTGQVKFKHPDIGNNPFYNFLIYYNRKATLPRLKKLTSSGLKMMRYDEYIRGIVTKEQAV